MIRKRRRHGYTFDRDHVFVVSRKRLGYEIVASGDDILLVNEHKFMMHMSLTRWHMRLNYIYSTVVPFFLPYGHR